MTLRDDFAVQHRGFEAAVRDSFAQVGFESVEQAGALLRHDHHFLPRRGVSVLGYGAMVLAQVSGDPPEAGTLCEHLVDQGVMGTAAPRYPTVRLLNGLRGFTDRSGRLLDQTSFVLGDQAFDCSGKVLPQLEAISDLHRFRCSGPGAFGIGTRPVPADHLG